MPRQTQDKKDFEFLSQLVFQNQKALHTPGGLWILQVIVGLVTSGLPIGLFFTSYYSVDSLAEGAPFFTIGALASSVVLAMAYNHWALCVRSALYAERESTISQLKPEQREMLESNTFVESTSLAMFRQNLTFFLAYGFFTAYLMPAYASDDKWNYLFSSIFASASTLGFGRLYHSIKL